MLRVFRAGGAHNTGLLQRIAAAKRFARLRAASMRQSNPNTHGDSNPNSDSDADTNAHSDALHVACGSEHTKRN